jgi:hypothetical protein
VKCYTGISCSGAYIVGQRESLHAIDKVAAQAMTTENWSELDLN